MTRLATLQLWADAWEAVAVVSALVLAVLFQAGLSVRGAFRLPFPCRHIPMLSCVVPLARAVGAQEASIRSARLQPIFGLLRLAVVVFRLLKASEVAHRIQVRLCPHCLPRPRVPQGALGAQCALVATVSPFRLSVAAAAPAPVHPRCGLLEHLRPLHTHTFAQCCTQWRASAFLNSFLCPQARSACCVRV